MLEFCKGGVDVVIDFVSLFRIVYRIFKIFNRVSKIKVFDFMINLDE